MARDFSVVPGPSAPPTGGVSAGEILWAVGGVVLAIILVLIFFFYIWRREEARRAHERIDHPPAAGGADEDKIRVLRTMKYSAPDLEDGKPDMHECEICLEDFIQGETLTLLECEHYYHRDCIRKWLRLKNACPI